MNILQAGSKLKEARAIMMLVTMTDELPHELKNETALAACAAQRLVEEAMEALDIDMEDIDPMRAA